ncbi:endonuclease V [Candidatus Woesearchaeota archaeon]|nr:endonuclease V [Candidatus Woesearchaeota archaeon]
MKPRINIGNLKDGQQEVASQIRINEDFSLNDVKYVAGFDVAFLGNQTICAAVVMEASTGKIVEKKTSIAPTPMNFIPGFQAFREGPPICQIYYDLEYEPDVLVVPGSGIAHPVRCGLACFVGVELGKPTIGVAKSIQDAKVEGEDIFVDGLLSGKLLKTKEHANELYVSPGNIIPITASLELLKKFICLPHKLPEMLHVAHRLAKKALEEKRNGPSVREMQIESE